MWFPALLEYVEACNEIREKVKKKLEDLGIFLLSGFLIGIATYNFASHFLFLWLGLLG